MKILLTALSSIFLASSAYAVETAKETEAAKAPLKSINFKSIGAQS